jgi:peptidoglycan-associated lipoprotein
MKLTKFANLLVIALALTVAASGCRKKPTGVTPLPNPYVRNVKEPGPGLPNPQPIPSEPIPRGIGTGGDTGLTGHPQTPAGMYDGWPEDKAILKADTVYFAFDSSVIKASEKPKVTAVADYLKANPANALRVEGNCDERGTEEYNRSLGERRALAVREELISLGVDPNKIVTKSWGKDNPENDPGHDEAAWKKNRRDDFIVLSPPGK